MIATIGPPQLTLPKVDPIAPIQTTPLSPAPVAGAGARLSVHKISDSARPTSTHVVVVLDSRDGDFEHSLAEPLFDN